MGRRRRFLGSLALTAAVVAPVAVLMGVAAALYDDDTRPRLDRPSDGPSLLLTMVRPNSVARTLEVEATLQEQRAMGVDPTVLAGAPVDDTLASTDDALADLGSGRGLDADLLDLTGAAATLRDGLAEARSRTDTAAAAAGDLTVAADVRARYDALTIGFEDAVAAAVTEIDDADTATAATLSWHATRRARAAGDLYLALLGTDPDPVELPIPPELGDLGLPPLPDLPPELVDPDLLDPDLLDPDLLGPELPDPGVTDPGLLDPELVDPDLPPPPDLSDPLPPPEATVPAPPAPLAAPASLARNRAPAVQAVTAAAGLPRQVPGEPTASTAPPGMADIVARLRSAEAALAAAPEPYGDLVAAELGDTAPLLSVADRLLAGETMPWGEVMRPPDAAVSSVRGLASDIAALYDREVRPDVPPRIVPSDRHHSVRRGIAVGAIAFAVVVALVTALVAVLDRIGRTTPSPAEPWTPFPGGPGSPPGPPTGPGPYEPVPTDAAAGEPAPPWQEGPWQAPR